MLCPYPLPLWERVHSRSEAGRGVSIRGDRPLTRLDFASLDLATLSHKGRGQNKKGGPFGRPLVAQYLRVKSRPAPCFLGRGPRHHGRGTVTSTPRRANAR